MGYWPSYNVPFYPEIYRQAVPLAGSALFCWHAGQRKCVPSLCCSCITHMQSQQRSSSCGGCCRRAGYKAFMEQQQRRGADFVAAAKQKSYQLAPRATIFRRDAGSVTDLAALKRLMRSNSFRTDPVRPAGLPLLSLHSHNAMMQSGLPLMVLCSSMLCTYLTRAARLGSPVTSCQMFTEEASGRWQS